MTNHGFLQTDHILTRHQQGAPIKLRLNTPKLLSIIKYFLHCFLFYNGVSNELKYKKNSRKFPIEPKIVYCFNIK